MVFVEGAALSWPPRWDGPQFKGPRVTTKQLRARKSGRLKRAENKNKERVREREGHRCRFPLCPCDRRGLFLEVSHKVHKGMGGDPTGELSVPELMVLVCNWRHKEGSISIDRETLKWEPLTDAGANGPIAWFLKGDGLDADRWYELARELEPGKLAPMFRWQAERLRRLSLELLERCLGNRLILVDRK